MFPVKHRTIAAALCLMLVLLLPLPGNSGAALALSSEWARTDVSQARLVAAAAAVGDAEFLRLGIQFQLDPEWKIYWRSPGDSGSPPTPDFSASRNVRDVEIAWPAPQRFFELADLETVGYVDEVVLPLRVQSAEPGATVQLRATMPYQACKEICIPFVADLALDLPPGAAAATPFARLIDRHDAKVPGAPEAAAIEVAAWGIVGAPPEEQMEIVLRSPLPFTSPALFVEAPHRYRVPASSASLESDNRLARLTAPVESRRGNTIAGQMLTLTVVDGDRALEISGTAQPLPTGLAAGAISADAMSPSATPVPKLSGRLLLMLALALLGGLILNLMPCVLPVLSLKLIGAIGHGGSAPRQVRLSFIASAAGIVTSFLMLAAAALAAKLAGGAVGWGIQFQQPLFLVFLVLVLVVFASNLLGLFEISLPGWLGAAGLHAEQQATIHGGSMAGHFMTGAFATLLATPCSAPFLGTAVSFALSRGALEIFLIFLALGVGMAAPYLAVAARPRLVTRLPRPGRWMLWMRALLGLALIGTAIWLLLVLVAQAGERAALALAVICVAFALLARLAARPVRFRPAAWAGLAVLAGAAFLAPAWTPPPATPLSAAESLWQPFDRATLEKAVADGRTVLVDVTADWCVTCKVNKTLVLDTEPVRRRLAHPSVLAMRADWTRPDPGISDYLASFGRYGIPFNAVYGPRAKQGIPLPELLRADVVTAALDRAG